MANLKLKSLRVGKNLTQKDMALILKISVNAYNRKELGLRKFTLEEANKICSLFSEKYENIFFEQKCNTKGT